MKDVLRNNNLALFYIFLYTYERIVKMQISNVFKRWERERCVNDDESNWIEIEKTKKNLSLFMHREESWFVCTFQINNKRDNFWYNIAENLLYNLGNLLQTSNWIMFWWKIEFQEIYLCKGTKLGLRIFWIVLHRPIGNQIIQCKVLSKHVKYECHTEFLLFNVVTRHYLIK